MQEAQIPSRLWDYGLVYIAEVQSLLARGPLQRFRLKLISGQTPDISERLDLYFYDRVWYWDQKKMKMSDEQARIGRWLGIAHRIGSDMTYWILTEAGNVIARSTVQHITVTEIVECILCIQSFVPNKVLHREVLDCRTTHVPQKCETIAHNQIKFRDIATSYFCHEVVRNPRFESSQDLPRNTSNDHDILLREI
jgi:hypothetical protein